MKPLTELMLSAWLDAEARARMESEERRAEAREVEQKLDLMFGALDSDEQELDKCGITVDRTVGSAFTLSVHGTS